VANAGLDREPSSIGRNVRFLRRLEQQLAEREQAALLHARDRLVRHSRWQQDPMPGIEIEHALAQRFLP